MIIKKRHAPYLPHTSSEAAWNQSEQADSRPGLDASPIQFSEQDFREGRFPDRRREDRREGLRRTIDQEIVTRAHEEANAIREVAAQEGFNAGLGEASAIVEELKQAINQLMASREEALTTAADDLAAMALEIAERIIKTEVSCDESLVMSIVRDTIAKVGRDQKSILIKVNSADVRLVREALDTNPPFSQSVEVLVAEDPEVEAGSCIVETRAGQIDARFSTRLGILKQLLLTGGKF